MRKRRAREARIVMSEREAGARKTEEETAWFWMFGGDCSGESILNVCER